MRGRRSMSPATQGREADGPRRIDLLRGSFRHRSRDRRRAKRCVHPAIVKTARWRQAPRHDLLRSIELQRAGNDRNAFWRPRWARGQGALGRRYKLMAQGRARQADPNAFPPYRRRFRMALVPERHSTQPARAAATTLGLENRLAAGRTITLDCGVSSCVRRHQHRFRFSTLPIMLSI